MRAKGARYPKSIPKGHKSGYPTTLVVVMYRVRGGCAPAASHCCVGTGWSVPTALCSGWRYKIIMRSTRPGAGGPQAETRVVARAPRASPGVVRPPRRTSHEPFRSTLPFRRDAAAHSSAPRLVPSKVYHGNWINQSLGSKNVRYSGSSAAVTSGGGSLSSR